MTVLLAEGDARLQMFVAQVGGFVIMMAILHRFVWGHLKGFLARRRDAIRETFDAIEREGEETRRRAEESRRRLDGVGREAEGRFARAVSEGEKTRGEILTEARAVAQVEADKVSREIAHEGDKAVVELRLHVVGRVLAAAESAVRSAMSPELHARIVDRALADLDRVAP